MNQTLKDRYDYYVDQLSLLRQMMTNLTKRHVSFKKRCENSLITHLFNLGRLKKMHDCMQDVYSSFDELAGKRTFLWGMISMAYPADDSYISKTLDHVYEDIDSLNEKLQKVDKFIRIVEK